MTRRLAIIPARGGSKRLPQKNIRDFCGKPMIAYTLDTARDSGLFDVIHVSTDCDETVRVVEGLGYQIDFPRPSDLADDETPLMPVLRWVAQTYHDRGQKFDEIWLLMACAPLIEVCDLQGAAQLLAKQKDAAAVLPVCAYSVPIEWAFDLGDDGYLHPANAEQMARPSQDIATKYHDTGSFVAYAASLILESEGVGDFSAFVAYELPKFKAIDIDDAEDWLMAERLYLGRQALPCDKEDT